MRIFYFFHPDVSRIPVQQPYTVDMNIKDRSLLQKAAAGNGTAIRQLWDLWSPRLDLYLKAVSGLTREDREDLVQEIMLKIYRSLDRYNPLYAPATWIYRIAGNTLTDWRRKVFGLRESQILNSTDNGRDERINGIPDNSPTPEGLYLIRERDEAVREFLNRQEERDRQILFLTGFEGLSGRAAARVMGIPPDTLRYRLKILKKKLEEELK